MWQIFTTLLESASFGFILSMVRETGISHQSGTVPAYFGFISLSADLEENKQPAWNLPRKQYNKEILWKEAERKVCLICCPFG